jgi:hypothetical protein
LTHGGTANFTTGGATFSTNNQTILLNSTGNISFGAVNANINANKNLIIQGAGAGTFSYTGTGTFLLATNVTITNQRAVNIDGYINGSNATTSIWLNDVNSTLNYTNATSPFTGLGVLNATATVNTVNYNGAGAQSICASNYYNLTISNGGVKSLSGNVSVSNTLLFNSDNTFLSLGAYSLTLGTAGTISNGSSLRYIQTDGTGILIKQGNTATDFKINYPIGSGGYYTPMNITALTATVNPGASISVNVVPVQRMSSTSALNKYWSVTATNVSSINADVSFTYDASEVTGAESNYVTRRFDGSTFQIPEGASINTTTKVLSAVGSVNLTGDWTAIDPNGVSPVINGPINVFQGRTQVYTITPGMSGYNWVVTGGTIISGSGTNAIVVTWNATPGSGSVSVGYTQNGFNISIPILTVTRSAFPLSCFQYYHKIDIKGTMVSGGPLTNFPILVNITDATLKSITNGGHIAHNAGYDIYFAQDAAGTQPLEYQIDYYDPATGQLIAWVKLSSLTNVNSSIYLFYGNYGITFDASTSDVWGADYVSVYHMGQSLSDYGVGCNDAINVGTSIATGKIGQGRLFNRNEKDFIQLTNEPTFKFSNQMTVSLWIKLNSYPAAGSWMDYIVKGDNKNWRFVGNVTNTNMNYCFGNEYTDDLGSANGSVPLGSWLYIVGTFNGNNTPSPLKNLFVNGVKTSITANHNSITGYLTDNSPVLVGINSQAQDTRAFDGTIDELRISNQFKTDDWIITEYRNQSDFTNVALSGSEQNITIPSGATGGIASANPGALFAREYSNLTLTGYTGTSIQWQASSDNINFTDLPGKTNNPQQTDPLLTNTYFRAMVTNGGCPSASSSAYVSVTPPYITCSNGKRKKITIDDAKYTGSDDLINFSFLLRIDNDADLKKAPAGKVQSANGWDIRFTSSDGVTMLPQQVESYDSSTGSILVWILIPRIYGAQNTDIYMYYGDVNYASSNPSIPAVFGSEYIGVYHLGSGTGRSLFELYDATGKGNDGVNNGTTNFAGGKIGAASNFNGTNKYITLPNESQFDIPNNGKLTLSGWVNIASYPTTYTKFIDKKGTNTSWSLQRNNNTNGIEMYQDYQSPEFCSAINSGGITAGSGWHYLVATYDHEVNNMTVYIDGSAAASSKNVPANQVLQNNNNQVRIGADAGTAANFFNGYIDEVRIQNVARTADWIKFEYDNMNNPLGFATISAEASCNLGAPTPGSASAYKTTLCSGQSTTLTLTGYTGGIYWQKSTDNTNWSFITGENSPTLNTGAITQSTYFRASVSNCCEAFSNSVLITYIGALPPALSFVVTNVTCNGLNNGSIDLTVSQGSGSYSYVWSNSAITQDISSLSPATYAVTATDVSNNCSISDQATITQPTALTVSILKTDETCPGSANGSATATPSGGTSPYTYLWSNGNTTSNITGLTNASYSLTVTDNKTCTITSSAAIETTNVAPPTTLIHHDE